MSVWHVLWPASSPSMEYSSAQSLKRESEGGEKAALAFQRSYEISPGPWPLERTISKKQGSSVLFLVLIFISVLKTQALKIRSYPLCRSYYFVIIITGVSSD